MEGSIPLTGLAWTSSQAMCPKDYKMIASTTDATSANFIKGFNQKSTLYLCYSTTAESSDHVISEVVMVTEKTPLPVGFAFIGEYIDTKVTVPKKKRLCINFSPKHATNSAVSEIKITVKNKQLGPPYTRIGDMSGLALWCKKVPVSASPPKPKPRNITSGIRGLSLDNGIPAQPSKTGSALAPEVTSRPVVKSPHSEHAIYEANIYGVSAIDGIPFTIHPMFESKIQEPNMISANFRDLRIKTLADIENEYNYGFVVERSACAR